MKILKKEIEKSYLLIVGIISILLLVGYYSYALFTVRSEEKKAISIVTGSLKSTLTSTDASFKSNQITVESKVTKTLDITLENQNGRDAKFNFYYEPVPEGVTVEYLSDTKDIPPTDAGVVIANKESKTYSVEIKNTTGDSVTVTFGSDAGLFDKNLSFPSKGHVLEEKIVEPNPPELGDRLIPVVYNVDTTNWEVADTETEKVWYDYEHQKWANAVVVTPDKYGTYKNAGTTVPMTDILQMYVWIPRYSYTIQGNYGKNGTNADNPGEIDIQFVSKDTKDSGTAKYSDEKPSGWYTPDAFVLGGQNLAGIWVGKFESGCKDATSKTSAQKCTLAAEQVVIRPNEYSWRSIAVGDILKISLEIAGDATFGMSKEIYDSHAMKNSEWGVVAYLTQSKYGKYGNSAYEGANKEVYINNNNSYKTGCSGESPVAANSSKCTEYNDLSSASGEGMGQKGPGASTTGTIYGVYDMSGGAQEYVMGNYNKEVGNGSNFKTGWETQYENYIDFYPGKTAAKACDGFAVCKGHALSETEGWYSDTHTMSFSMSTPYMYRGSYYGGTTEAGIFNFDTTASGGAALSGNSFRMVLTLK